MVTRVAINGFGRIGRNVFKVIENRDDIEVVAINDLTSPSILAHLLKYDSVHGRFQGKISSDETSITVNGKNIEVSSIRSPKDLPWASLNVDVVIESTGIFTSATSDKGGYNDHLTAGAKKVILTVPAKDEIKTVVLGVNTDEISEDINVYSNASCTTNCLAPIAKILNDNFKIKKGYMTTVHSYTSDQRILDFPHSDLRRARSAAMSIIPTSTGAAKAVSLVIPELKGKLDGIAMRVPTPDGSVVDLVCEVEKGTTKEEVNALIKEAANGAMEGVVEYVDEPIVSCDVIGNPHSSVFDSLLTMVDGNMIKIVSWYDNEIGYSSRVVDLVSKIAPSKVTG
ncbi:type I glyceraldehyde-3-phosphate dehydrogenase [bacterium]|jgi:glyceraldehyde 3-phosphate dehydrogenase|nr:type I glyceraldehyde-3-phosphate dehydrogenase [bacterium]